MDFRHLDYLKKTVKAAQSTSQALWGRGGRAGLAKPNCVPFEEPLMPFDCVGLLKNANIVPVPFRHLPLINPLLNGICRP